MSILPERTVAVETRAGSLAAVRLIAPELRRPVGNTHRQRTVFGPPVGKFTELLLESQDIDRKVL